MKLIELASRCLGRAKADADKRPADDKAHSRFEYWARMLSRIVRKPFAACAAAASDIAGRVAWRHATALALFLVVEVNFFLGAVLNPAKPLNPQPSRFAVPAGLQLTSTSVAAYSTTATFFPNTVIGREARPFMPAERKPATEQST